MAEPRMAGLAAPLIAVCACLWVALLGYHHLQDRASLLDPMENRLLDLRYRLAGPVPAAPDIVAVAIDDATLDAGQTGVVGRARLTRLIHHIADSGARVLALDVLLADAGPVTEQAALAAALTRMPTIIAAAARFDETGIPSVISPHPAFEAVADVGLVNLSTDARGIPRYVPMFIDTGGAIQPAMALLAAVALTGQQARIEARGVVLGARAVPLDAGSNMPLRLLGPTGTVPTISATRLLDGGLAEDLTGKLVVLGFTAAAVGDRFLTPFDEDTPGVEIIATAISQLVGGPTLRHDAQTRLWDVAHAAGLTLLCVLLMLRAPVVRGLVLALTLTVVSFAGLTVLFSQGLWLSAALPLAAVLPPVFSAGAMRLARERRQARRSARSLASLRQFQSPSLVRRIESDPDYLTKPQAQDLAIFFVDLTAFTALSQRLGPDGTRALLHQFHGLTAAAVESRGGSVINYMGDGALAVFGLDTSPATLSEADAALAAAVALENGLADVHPDPQVNPPLACRIGLHYGPVILSRLGAATHQQVSVSGDTVNLASRLMEVAKSESARIAASRDFTERLSTEFAPGDTKQAEIEVRGRDGRVAVVLWPRTSQRAGGL